MFKKNKIANNNYAMYKYIKSANKIRLTAVVMIVLASVLCSACLCARGVSAMPFYNLKPAQKIVLRAEFSTEYASSSAERKHNIALACKAINGTLIDVGKEFSFNRVVGARTEKRGYQSAKIIVNGEFVDGVGGGVCQVSTTLYNAALLAGLRISEFHPHSLQVGYVAPSFDAMVSGGGFDLRFINDTDNPIYIITAADGKKVKVSVYGQPMDCKYVRHSVQTGFIEPPEPKLVKDVNGEFPDLFIGQTKTVKWAKRGLKSEGYLIKTVDGKVEWTKKLRADRYAPIAAVVIEGQATPSESEDYGVIE